MLFLDSFKFLGFKEPLILKLHSMVNKKVPIS